MRTFRNLTGIMVLCILLGLSSRPAQALPLAGLTLAASNPYCVQVSTNSGTCTINLRYFNAATTDSSFSHIEIAINGKVRLYMTGFFENSANLTYTMIGDGFKVACGLPGASGVPGYGHQYQVNLSAYEMGSPPLIDDANVLCPSFISKNYLPLARK